MTDTLCGRVEWFDNKRGFGFVTYTTSNGKEEQVFVHVTNLNVKDDAVYKTLVSGEYIHFVLQKYEEGEKRGKFQATNVTGMNGGPLMCETRHLRRNTVRDRSEGGSDGWKVQSNRGNRHRRDDGSSLEESVQTTENVATDSGVFTGLNEVTQ